MIGLLRVDILLVPTYTTSGNAMSEYTKILQERQDLKKSNVRIYVTYVATIFIFGIGLGLILFFTLVKEKPDHAMRVFNAVLPIATGIVTYWFATRSNKKPTPAVNRSTTPTS